MMKPAMIALAAALVVAGPFAFAQSGGGSSGAGGPAASTGATGSATSESTPGSAAGSSTIGTGTGNTGGVSNDAGSLSAGRNSAQNPSGNSYINPPPGTAANPR
jgi:hypothetical protein